MNCDAHRRPVAAADETSPTPFSCEIFCANLVSLKSSSSVSDKRLRRDRERQDGRIGRIDLGVDWWDRQIAWQQVVRGIDRGLDLLLGDVEAEIEAELQRNDRRAGRTRRCHLVQARHLSELSFQRGSNGRGHHLRAGAGIEGLNLDGRVVDFRQGRQRQEGVGDDAGQHDRRHQERRADRAVK